MDLLKLENIIINTNAPLVLLLIVFRTSGLNNINDENKCIFIKFFFKHHLNLALEYNLIDLYNEFNYNNTSLAYNLILDIYNILKKQIHYIQLIKKLKLCYNYRSFWNKNIDEQIIHLKKLYEQLLYIFDGSKTQAFFHIRLKGNINDIGKTYHIEQIMERLKKTFSLFKSAFFKEHNIYLLSNVQFIDLTFHNMVKYTEYIFDKTSTNLIKYITYFEHYNYYRKELINILNVSESININIEETNSDIDDDDISLFV
jgi:hypothetical protein